VFALCAFSPDFPSTTSGTPSHKQVHSCSNYKAFSGMGSKALIALKNKFTPLQNTINLIYILNPEKSQKLHFRCSPVKAEVFQIHAFCTI
jgi:hypothetical protein